MNFLIFAVSFVVWTVITYAFCVRTQRATLRGVEKWMSAVESRARLNPEPLSIVEVPGYQGMLRQFRKRWIVGYVDGTTDR